MGGKSTTLLSPGAAAGHAQETLSTDENPKHLKLFGEQIVSKALKRTEHSKLPEACRIQDIQIYSKIRSETIEICEGVQKT